MVFTEYILIVVNNILTEVFNIYYLSTNRRTSVVGIAQTTVYVLHRTLQFPTRML